MAWASDMGAGTTSFKRVLGLYQCIICIGPPLSTSVKALATRCLLTSQAREDGALRAYTPLRGSALFIQLPSNTILGNSEGIERAGAVRDPGPFRMLIA